MGVCVIVRRLVCCTALAAAQGSVNVGEYRAAGRCWICQYVRTCSGGMAWQSKQSARQYLPTEYGYHPRSLHNTNKQTASYNTTQQLPAYLSQLTKEQQQPWSQQAAELSSIIINIMSCLVTVQLLPTTATSSSTARHNTLRPSLRCPPQPIECGGAVAHTSASASVSAVSQSVSAGSVLHTLLSGTMAATEAVDAVKPTSRCRR